MASQSRRPAASLAARLFAEPHRFAFAQAVRLLERIAAGPRRSGNGGGGAAGHLDPTMLGEVVQFRAALALSFPLAEIERLLPGDGNGTAAEMHVTFMGLDGPSGVLPLHYSALVAHELRHKNVALRDFLDLLNQRAISMHLAAWRKYRLAANVERSGGDGSDPLTAALYALVGLATPGLRDRSAVEDETFIYYGGLFAQSRRSAVGLEQLLSDYIGLRATVVQFAGRWAPLAPEDWTSLGTAQRPEGSFARLGVDAVAGTRVWDVQGGFRIDLGPLDYRQFAALLPGSPLMNEAVALTRGYAGPGLAFDIELALRGDAVPDCTLASAGEFLPHLGWNTWLAAPTRRAVARDAVLRFASV